MLLQTENPVAGNNQKLLDFAMQHQLKLTVIDKGSNYSLPGKPLIDKELYQMIEDGHKSSHIEMNIHSK